jgi:hypothetical protein
LNFGAPAGRSALAVLAHDRHAPPSHDGIGIAIFLMKNFRKWADWWIVTLSFIAFVGVQVALIYLIWAFLSNGWRS